MNKIKNIYFKFTLSFVLCLLSYVNNAQTKSNDIKTINGKKYYIHKVEKGQSLYAIAKTYSIDVNSILAENDEAIDGLKSGQELKIPFESLMPKQTIAIDTNKYVYHKIIKGETVYAITKKYAIDEKKLTSYNPTINSGLKEGNYLIVGEKKKSNISKSSTTSISSVSPSVVAVSKDTTVFHKTKKSVYNVGLFLPFKLVESETINIDELARAKASFPSTQSLAIDFYAGFKKAVDSLIAKDFEVTIRLFDADEKDSTKIEMICKSSDFRTLDVVFGPLYAGVFKLVSNHAKELGLPIVSPLTQQNKILFNNPFVSKVNPSQYTLIESLADYCTDSLLTSSNIIIVNTTSKDQQYIKTFKSRYNDALAKHNRGIKDTIVEVKGFAGVKLTYVPGKKNVVVLLTNNLVYLQDFITQLHVFSEKKDIALMGFNSVSNVDNLDQDYLNGLQFHFAAPNHIDFQDSTIRQLSKAYQEVFIADPTAEYFQGFDIGMYYLSNLKNKGPDFFMNLDKNSWEGVSTGFKFFRPDSETGFENRAVYIYKYSNYKLQKLGWK